ncbi:23S rRNA (adenine(2030)-N(6))-methyltransferase RlmJ [uncultured Roseobacter sp.]|uniref:23S rRNA (adenine(2030)-N(6))-methyltransferase RlmJ n=1 Tax=uncultured Roseobacter sp. TaxID=114847 RepID=UPI002614F536|nr:23S rRNA (adenine(2030)-N(6))-methyltransferase RlmJ [uncultured Roseobacter sp.]
MLSYQHMYHAGNLADVHKHGLLAWILAYLTRKDKPLTYIETHAGRALYDLSSEAAIRTGEAAQGIARAAGFFPEDHPFSRTLARIRAAHGAQSYPGSPLIACGMLRARDNLHLAELHPGEHAELRQALRSYKVKCHRQDGFELAHSLLPPSPRRGLLLIDPSYEIKSDFDEIPRHISRYHKAWNVGVICLWYPVLTSGAERAMVRRLRADHPAGFSHEVRFPPARPGHGMVGSGLFVINPPWGLQDEAARLASHFADLTG